MLAQLRQLAAYRAALRYLVLRELKVMYSNSLLGVVWSLFAPLLMMLVFTTVFTLFLPNPNLPHYPVYVLAGLLPDQPPACTSRSTAFTSSASLPSTSKRPTGHRPSVSSGWG